MSPTKRLGRLRERFVRLRRGFRLGGLILFAAGDLVMQLSHLPPELACCGLPPATPRARIRKWYTTNGAMFAAGRRQIPIRTPSFSRRGWLSIPLVRRPRRSGHVERHSARCGGDYGMVASAPGYLGVGTPAGTIASLELLPPQKLADLATKYRAGYAIVQLIPGVPKLPLKQVYANNTYAIYRFSPGK